jgi:hypothetical protein
MTALRPALAAFRRALGDVKLVALLLAANLAPAALAAAAPAADAWRAFGHSLVGRSEPFLGGDVGVELARLAQKSGGAWGLALALAFALSLPLQIALSGGVAARALEGRAPFSAADFCADCARLFGRNVRLFGWALLGLVPVGLLAAMTAALVGNLGDPLGERSLFAWRALRFALLAAAFATWRLAFDAAKVRAVSAEPRAMWRAAARGARAALVTRGLWPVYVALGVAGALALLAAARLHAALPVTTAGGALLAFAFGQVVLAVRLVFSVAATNYVAHATGLDRAAPPAPPPLAPAIDPS